MQCGKSLYHFGPLASDVSGTSGTAKPIAGPFVPHVPLILENFSLYIPYIEILYNTLFNLSGTSGTIGTVSGFLYHFNFLSGTSGTAIDSVLHCI